VALIVLDRPEARNAMNAQLATETVDTINGCQDAAAIVLTGTDPAFCAGLDLRDLGVEHLSELPQFIAAAASSKVPVVAAVNGPAVTGGLELALACDFIVASDRARFADTHLRVGVYPGPVLVDLPRRVGMARAREMSLTGNFVDAETALRIGLANHVVPHEALLEFALELARAIAEQDPNMVRTMREDWESTDRLPLPEAHRLHADYARKVGFASSTGAGIAAHGDEVIARARAQR
jgi:enoyl-CoA hydratase